MTALPDCPSCDTASSLELIRADDKGLMWAVCKTCSKTVLIAPDGRILHRGS